MNSKISRKRLAGILVVGVICAGIVLAGNLAGGKKAGTILDSEGNQIAELVLENGELNYQCEEEYKTYVDVVRSEVLDIVMQKENVDEKAAMKKIVSDEMEIRTAFSKKALAGMMDAYNANPDTVAGTFAAALSDTKGNMIACYSASANGDTRNFVTLSTYAGSAIKPLSVYTLALEEGVIVWSSLYRDIPYAWIEDKNGEMTEWPKNTKPFTEKKLPVEEAVRMSNNAIAVKVLKDYGVEKSCQFLEKAFGISTEKEKEILMEKGDDRVLSNIALGYLKDGVTVPQMLEAYQIYANGGVKYSLHTVTEVQRKGKTYYKAEEKAERIIREETAYIMNRLMRTVVEDGTGTAAQVEGVDVCGKTGTSDYGDHWFVGTTPEYVCAVWYKANASIGGVTASSARVFSDTIEVLEPDKDASYPIPENVCEEMYCRESGLLAGEACKNTAVGYYEKGGVPKVCSECKKE